MAPNRTAVAALAAIAACTAVAGASSTEERLDAALHLVESMKKQAAIDKAHLREMQAYAEALRTRVEDLENIAHNMLVEGAPATEERGSGGPSRLFEDAAAIDAAESGLGTCSGSECEAGDDELTLPLDGLAAAEDPVLPDESEVPVRPDGSARGAAGKAPPPGRRTLEVQRLADSPRVFFVPNFLTEAEVMHVNAITHPSKARSRGFRVREDFTGASYEQPISEDPALRRIASRMEHLIGFKNEFGGTFRIRRYAEGEYHPPHTDTYTVRGENVTLLVTLITYLTDVEEGGETVFPDAVPAPVSIVPKRGGLGVWFSCNEEGGDDRFSEHEGKKVVRGRKWTATYFVYNKPLPHCAEPVTLNAEVSV